MTPQDKSIPLTDSELYNSEIEPQYLIKESKFLLLTISTFGFYLIWWLYKTWRFFIQKEGSDGNAAIRVIFCVFFLLPLFNKVQRFAKEEGYQGSNSPLLSFIFFLVFSLFSFTPSPLSLFSFLCYFFFLPTVKALNYALEHSSEICSYEDEGLSTGEIVLVVIGSIIWVFVAIGMSIGL